MSAQAQSEESKRRYSVSAECSGSVDKGKVANIRKTPEQMERARKVYLKAKPGIFFLSRLTPEYDKKLIQALKEVKVPIAGMRVITEGEDGDNFYFIESGHYGVLKESEQSEEPIHVFKDEGSFGELALLYNQPRLATVMCKKPGILWAIDRISFRVLIQELSKADAEKHEKLLGALLLAADLSHEQLQKVADALEPEEFRQGQVIVKEGDKGDGMYFIKSGEVIVQTRANDSEDGLVQITTLGSGEYFGESALVTNAPRMATVKAKSKTVETLKLDSATFTRLLGPCTPTMLKHAANYKMVKEAVIERRNSCAPSPVGNTTPGMKSHRKSNATYR